MHQDAPEIDASSAAKPRGRVRLLRLERLDGLTGAAKRVRELISALAVDLADDLTTASASWFSALR